MTDWTRLTWKVWPGNVINDSVHHTNGKKMGNQKETRAPVTIFTPKGDVYDDYTQFPCKEWLASLSFYISSCSLSINVFFFLIIAHSTMFIKDLESLTKNAINQAKYSNTKRDKKNKPRETLKLCLFYLEPVLVYSNLNWPWSFFHV